MTTSALNRRLRRPLAVVVLTTYAVTRVTAAQCEIDKMLASDGETRDFFGASVAISGDLAVVGSPEDDDRGANAGAVYAFRREGAEWVEEDKLLAADGAPGDFFGFSVSIAGDAVLVGAWGCDDRGTNAGAAYVFRRDGPGWNEEAKLTASDGATDDQLGRSVALDTDVAVVGAPRADHHGDDSGAACVFRLIDDAWTEDGRLLPAESVAGDLVGHAVAARGGVAVIGAPGCDVDAPDAGAAFVFRYDGEEWAEEARLVASDPAALAQLGWSVGIADGVTAAGANRDPENGQRSGAAYLYRSVEAEWVEEAKLMPADGAADDHFGHSIAIGGSTLLVGARWDDDNGLHAGSAYVFRGKGQDWLERAKVLAPDGAAEDKFGFAVGLDGETAIVGAFGRDDLGDDSGAAYMIDVGRACECIADIDGTGVVDFADLLLLLAQWGSCPPVCLGDLDGDGTIDFRDLLMLLAAWGPCE